MWVALNTTGVNLNLETWTVCIEVTASTSSGADSEAPIMQPMSGPVGGD